MSFEGGSLSSDWESNIFFKQNIASIGGAICFRNVGEVNNLCGVFPCYTYENNTALLGGAVYSSSEHELSQFINVRSTPLCPS